MRILIAYDGSASADAAIEDLGDAGLPPDAEALVLSVADGHLSPQHLGPREPHSEHSWMARLAEAETLAVRGAERLGALFPRWRVSSEALWGAPANIIMNTCGSWHPDLIVVGSHGHSAIARVFLGSVSLELIHKAPCSVRVTRFKRTRSGGPLQIVIGSDGSPDADAAIHAVSARSWPENAEAHVISVAQTLVPAPTGLEASTFEHEPAFTMIREADEHERIRLHAVAEDSADVLRQAGLEATAHVVDGVPGEAILNEAEVSQADVIFVGAGGMGRMERLLLGSVSTHIVTHARCTVEVIRKSNQDNP